MGVAGENEAANWAAEFARTGEARVPPRRRLTALKSLLYGFVLANETAAVVSATLGRRDWLWWPLFCLVSVPLFTAVMWMYVRMSLFGQPVLVMDTIGLSLGRKRLAWQEITTIESPNSLRRRPSDPRQPVGASRGWFKYVTIIPATQSRKRQISVGKDYVRDLEGLAAWLDALRREQQTRGRAL
jgi:hypothetical protein